MKTVRVKPHRRRTSPRTRYIRRTPPEQSEFTELFSFSISDDEPNYLLWNIAIVKAAQEVDAKLVELTGEEGSTVYVFDKDISQERIADIMEEEMKRAPS